MSLPPAPPGRVDAKRRTQSVSRLDGATFRSWGVHRGDGHRSVEGAESAVVRQRPATVIRDVAVAISSPWICFLNFTVLLRIQRKGSIRIRPEHRAAARERAMAGA